MSVSLAPSGRVLRWRVGPYFSARRVEEWAGSTCSIIFELLDTHTRALVPADGLSVIYIRPRPLGDPPLVEVPVPALLLRPGRWQVDVPLEIPGRYDIDAITIGARPETCIAKITSI